MPKEIPELLISDNNGKLFSVPNLEATGMKGSYFFRLAPKEFIKLPPGSELFMLPGRMPVGYDPAAKDFIKLDRDPFSKKKKKCFAVAAFLSPGSTGTYISSYVEIARSKMLPLFSYTAVALYKGEFYVAAVRVDKELRQDLRFMNIALVKKNVINLRRFFPHNRLMRHLEGCALVYGCPAAKNFFLSRYEAPLPTSPFCNARCVGCISYQPPSGCPVTQPRIKFIPTPEEISETALFHMKNVADPVVSFGQGCEGEPLLVSDTLERAIKLVRKKTSKGMINLNTNASKPGAIARLFDAGLDSIRVSMNSIRKEYYVRYYKPKNYTFGDVVKSIRIARRMRRFVSINYLTMPGFTDSKSEYFAFKNFMENTPIDMIQWRNLNFDPLMYFRNLKISVEAKEMLGVSELIKLIKRDFPNLAMGYFNPSRARIRRSNEAILDTACQG